MNKLNRTLFLLILYLLFLFGLEMLEERIGLFTTPPVFFIFIALAILITIAFPILSEISRGGVILFWEIGYLICRTLINPIAIPVNTRTILFILVELVLLGLAVLITNRLIGMLLSFELLQDKLVKPSPNIRIKFIKDNLDEINAEFSRCRRYNHTLSILAIEPTLHSVEYQGQSSRKSQRMLMKRFITLNLSEVISLQIRQFDMILIKDWRGRFYILCPENNAAGTEKLALRINKITEKSMGITMNYAFVIFPNDALTLEELIIQADSKLNYLFTSTSDTQEIALEEIEIRNQV